MANEYLLEIKNVRKEFPGVIALDNVSLFLKRGEIHALVGENGAGARIEHGGEQPAHHEPALLAVRAVHYKLVAHAQIHRLR